MAGEAGALLQELKQTTVRVEGPDGDVIDVAPQQAHDGFVSGAFKYLPDEKYFVADPETNAPVEVDAQTAARMSASNRFGTQMLSRADDARDRAEAQYGGLGSRVLTGVEGAADELTFGLAPVVGRAIGGQDYADRRQIQETVNENSDLLGRGVGLGVGLLYGAGEAGAAAKGAGLVGRGLRAAAAPTRAVLEGGAALERGAVALGEAAGLAEGGLAARTVGSAARGLGEGAAFSTGSELGRQAVHDPDLDGERLLTAGLQGALAGGAIGGAIPVVGAGLMRGGRAVGSALGRAGEAVGSRVETALAERVGAAEGSRVAMARQEALKSTGAGKRLLSEMTGDVEALSGDGKRISDRILYEAEKDLKLGGRIPSQEEGLAWAEGRRLKAGAAIEDTIAKAEALVPGQPVELHSVFDRLGDEAVALSKSAANHTAGNEAFAYMQRLADQIDGGGLRTLQQARIELDRMAGWGVPTPKPLKEFYQGLSRELEGVVEATIGRAEAAGAKGLGREYLGAKADYGDFKTLSKMYEEGVNRLRANRIGGLPEHLALSSGGPVTSLAQGAGAAVGGLFGGVPGAFVGREVAGAFGRVGDAALQRSIKTRGSAVAAQTLRDLPATGLVQGGVNAARGLLGDAPAAAKLLNGAERLVSREGRARALDYVTGRTNALAQTGRRLEGAGRGVAEQSRRQEIERLKADRALAQARVVGQQLEAQYGPAPAVKAMADRLNAAQSRLTQPELPPAPGPVTGARLPESAVHADKLSARRATIARPEAVLSRAANGTLTADQIDTMAEVVPRAFALARANAEAVLAGATRETPMSKLVAASLVLGRPADPALRPHVLGAVQASLQKQRTAQQQQSQDGGGAGGRSAQAAKAKMSLPGATANDSGASPGLVGGEPI